MKDLLILIVAVIAIFILANYIDRTEQNQCPPCVCVCEEQQTLRPDLRIHVPGEAE